MTVEFEPYSHLFQHDPYPTYRALRDHDPVHFAPESNVWCISRYEDVEFVLTHPELFSSRTPTRGSGSDIRKMGPIDRTLAVIRSLYRLRVTPWAANRSRMLIQEDGEVHHGLRTIVNRGFTPRRIRAWQTRIDELVDSCLARARRGEPFDLVHDLAVPLPVTVIAEMLGVDARDMHKFKSWSDMLIKMSTGSGRTESGQAGGLSVLAEMREYLMPIVRARRSEPRDDLISTIVHAEPGEKPLTDHELLMFFVLLMVAGNETTTNLLGNCVHALLDHEEVLKDMAADPSAIPGLVEETLRYDNPVQFLDREVSQDVEIRGVKIPRGEIAVVMLGSANRDERKFPEPDRFDPRRVTRNHLGFGFGHHFCLGASLARLEATGALKKLVPELLGLERVTSKREFIDSYVIRGPKRLELRPAGHL
jgi:cytochrome P450